MTGGVGIVFSYSVRRRLWASTGMRPNWDDYFPDPTGGLYSEEDAPAGH